GKPRGGLPSIRLADTRMRRFGGQGSTFSASRTVATSRVGSQYRMSRVCLQIVKMFSRWLRPWNRRLFPDRAGDDLFPLFSPALLDGQPALLLEGLEVAQGRSRRQAPPCVPRLVVVPEAGRIGVDAAQGATTERARCASDPRAHATVAAAQAASQTSQPGLDA